MFVWLSQYIGTIIICLILVAVFGLLIWSMIRDKKKGKSSCGGSCSSCAMGYHCHAAPSQAADDHTDSAPKSEKGASQ